MLDNISLHTRWENATLATDLIEGVHFPRFKLAFGVPDIATDVSADNPLPVSLVGGAPGGGLTDAQLRASAVPVSGPLTDTQLRASSVTVAGTFWQATQPVSAASLPLPAGAGTSAKQDTIIGYIDGIETLLGGTLNVAGAFYPATQPVSGTVSISGSTAVTGTFWQATQPVSLASLPALVAGSALVGKVGIDQTTPGTTNAFALAQIGSTAVASGNGTASAGCQRVAVASDNSALSVVAPTLTKGTQGAAGFSVQDLKDSGRNSLMMTAEFAFAQTGETLLTTTLSANGGATSTFTSRTITNGKKLRVQSAILQVELLGSGTTPQRAYLRMRANTAGATTASSPLQWILPCGVTTAIVKATNWASIEIPDGFELNGDGTATFGFTLETPEWVTTTATGRAKITIFAFEY